MKGSGIFLILILAVQPVLAQMDLFSFTSMVDQNPRKLESQLQKKGFNRSGYHSTHEMIFIKNTIEDSTSIHRSFHVIQNEGLWELLYKTSSKEEFSHWEKEIRNTSTSFSGKEKSNVFYCQKQGITLHYNQEKEDTTVYYVVSASRKPLPKIKDLVYAEDLLEFDAHIYLQTVFGTENVKEDVFYFSETMQNKCSIIYPNTSRQAIFLWKDEKHLKDLSFIIIGEPSNRSHDQKQHQVTLPSWRSKQGIGCGMNLSEVEMLNRAPINFYKWRTTMAGALAPGNIGSLNFEKLELVFDCLNCNFIQAEERSEVIDSKTANELSQRWYISSFAVIKLRVIL
ncbi:MAG: hypothetical protein H0U44_01575 [Flavisolibacter sp.]|nr:hypothetical protein [Flavisolibacter sp.]